MNNLEKCIFEQGKDTHHHHGSAFEQAVKAPAPLPTVQDCLILPPFPKEEPRPSPPPHDSAQTSISMPCPSHPAVPPRVPVDPAAALGLTLFSMTPSTRGHPRPLRRPGQRHPRTASRSTSRPLMMLCDRLHTKSTSCDIQEYHELLKEQKMMILYVFFCARSCMCTRYSTINGY